MAIYLILIAIEIVLALFVKVSFSSKAFQERIIAKVGMFLVFLLLALKADTVGIDILGYKSQYELAGLMPWNDFSYVYFEKGYLFLTKLFAKLGVSFQLFTILLYAFWCYAVYLLIKKYSSNATLSILVFICYSFLIFSITGLRQTLAMALCLYAFFLCTHNTRKTTVFAIALTIMAVLVHESAIVFFLIFTFIWIMQKRVKIHRWILITAAVIVSRSLLWRIVGVLYQKTMTSFVIGGNFIFLIGMLVFIAFTYHMQCTKPKKSISNEVKCFDFDSFSVRMIFICVMCYIVFSGGTLLRANMYYMMFLIPSIPRSISCYPARIRVILNVAMGAFMIILFYKEGLLVNQMQIWPYTFFWQ